MNQRDHLSALAQIVRELCDSVAHLAEGVERQNIGGTSNSYAQRTFNHVRRLDDRVRALQTEIKNWEPVP